MARKKDICYRTVLLAATIFIVGIIHLGVGIGICAKYSKYNDIFQQQIGLAGYDIFVALVSIAVGLLGIFSTIYDYPFIS